MSNLQQLQDTFWLTRVEAKAANKAMVKDYFSDSVDLHNKYVKAWEAHQKASIALFLAECEQE